MGLIGILLGLTLLVWLAFRGWSVLLLAPVAALVAAAFAGEPLLAHWTQTFMGSAARFIAQFFPLFLLGALFGKLMEDSGSVSTMAAPAARETASKRANPDGASPCSTVGLCRSSSRGRAARSPWRARWTDGPGRRATASGSPPPCPSRPADGESARKFAGREPSWTPA